MKTTTPKQLLKLSGKTVLEHTLDVFCRVKEIDGIIAVVPDSKDIELGKKIHKYDSLKPLTVVSGGQSRNLSTLCGLDAIKDVDAKVLIHDSVRPLVTENLISLCIETLDECDAVDTAIPTSDTLIKVQDGFIEDIPKRSEFWRGQTPQGFRLDVIKFAYKEWLADGCPPFTDDCGLVLHYLAETRVKVVDGDSSNIKITEPIDLHIAEKLFQLRVATLDGNSASRKLSLPKGQIVVVAGNSGIGKAISEQLNNVGLGAVALSRQTGGPDVLDYAALEYEFEQIARKGDISAVVNCAARLETGNLETSSIASIEESLQVNLLGSFLVAKAALPHLRQSKGHLLLFGSSSYTRGRAGYSTYSASKAGIVNLTQSLADEWHEYEIKVNCLNPERTKTPLRHNAFGKESPEGLLRADQVAEVVTSILSSENTGMIFDVKLPS
jgi:2-C-methyl-D-erythritol 4-phosphate cytidylyltransferase